MNNRILSTLSLCRRAAKLTYGFDMVKRSLMDGSAMIVFLAKDVSEKTKKEIVYLCEQTEVEVSHLPFTIDEIWYAIGKRAAVLAVTDEGLADKLIEMISGAYKEECII